MVVRCLCCFLCLDIVVLVRIKGLFYYLCTVIERYSRKTRLFGVFYWVLGCWVMSVLSLSVRVRKW